MTVISIVVHHLIIQLLSAADMETLPRLKLTAVGEGRFVSVCWNRGCPQRHVPHNNLHNKFPSFLAHGISKNGRMSRTSALHSRYALIVLSSSYRLYWPEFSCFPSVFTDSSRDSTLNYATTTFFVFIPCILLCIKLSFDTTWNHQFEAVT